MLKHIVTLSCILAAWFAAIPLIAIIPGISNSVRVYHPSETFLSQLPEGTRIVSWNDQSIAMSSDAPNFVLSLYKSGAKLVLPAGMAGCVDLSFTAQTSYI